MNTKRGHFISWHPPYPPVLELCDILLIPEYKSVHKQKRLNNAGVQNTSVPQKLPSEWVSEWVSEREKPTNQPSNYMKQSPSWEANTHSDNQGRFQRLQNFCTCCIRSQGNYILRGQQGIVAKWVMYTKKINPIKFLRTFHKIFSSLQFSVLSISGLVTRWSKPIIVVHKAIIMECYNTKYIKLVNRNIHS